MVLVEEFLKKEPPHLFVSNSHGTDFLPTIEATKDTASGYYIMERIVPGFAAVIDRILELDKMVILTPSWELLGYIKDNPDVLKHSIIALWPSSNSIDDPSIFKQHLRIGLDKILADYCDIWFMPTTMYPDALLKEEGRSRLAMIDFSPIGNVYDRQVACGKPYGYKNMHRTIEAIPKELPYHMAGGIGSLPGRIPVTDAVKRLSRRVGLDLRMPSCLTIGSPIT